MRIVNYLGGQTKWGDISPDTLKSGMGGRETALVQLSEQWAKTGHEVISFVPTKEPSQHGARYVPAGVAREYLSFFPADVLVSWEEPKIFSAPRIRANIKLGMIEMQVAHLDTSPELDQHVDAYATLSDWAGHFLHSQAPFIQLEKIGVFPNGVDLARYPEPRYQAPSEPFSFYYSSSPDRGLHHLLRMWPKIRAKYHGATLHVAYGVEAWLEHALWSHHLYAEAAWDIKEGLNQEGVIYHGQIGQDQLAQFQANSTLMLYPCNPSQPTETGCISALEAFAACTPVVTTNADCLESEFEDYTQMVHLPLDGSDFSEDAYLRAIDEVLENKDLYVKLQEKGHKLAQERSWDVISRLWLQFMEDYVSRYEAN